MLIPMATRRLLAGALIVVAKEEAWFLIDVLSVSRSKDEEASLKFKALSDEKCKFCSGEMLELTIKKRA